MNKDDEYRENAAECERMARIPPPGGEPAARGLRA
jgi:hypothetical protein